MRRWLNSADCKAWMGRPQEHHELTSDVAWESWHRERGELWQQTSLPALIEFHDWMAATETRVLPMSPVGQLIRYGLARWNRFTCYC